MSLESATYVNQLVVSNPDGADPKGQGDDHLRLIKNTLKNTFPNLNAAVTVTPAELNSLAGGLYQFRTGMIVLWRHQPEAIPVGWVLCNGTANTPDLRGLFVMGAGGSIAVGTTGGTTSHTHSISVAGTSLTVAQLPPHTHPPAVAGGSFITGGAGAGNTNPGSNIGSTGSTGVTGSGAAHDHPASAGAANNLPPFHALCYIMKT